MRLTVLRARDDYLEFVRRPRFGYVQGMAPCLDCRIYMFRQAQRTLAEFGAGFVVSGEVLGQRPQTQKRRDLEAVAYHAGLEDLLVRPLSAQLLPATLPERMGWIDRSRLHAFHGTSRRGLIELAGRLGLPPLPASSKGCALIHPEFARKARDLLRFAPSAGRWDFDLLYWGRHFRGPGGAKVVVGRDAAENAHLEYLHGQPAAASSALLLPHNYGGATGLIVGPLDEPTLRFAGGLMYRYGRAGQTPDPQMRVLRGGDSQIVPIARLEAAEQARTVAS